MRKIINNKGVYITAFIIPWIIIIVHSVLRNGWPFGVGTILRGDACLQYYQLCVELWNKVHSGSSLFYSWNAGDGFDFYLNLAYYLISPFTIIILAVPKRFIADAVQAVMILKWSFMYVTMLFYFLHTNHNKLNDYKKIISFVLASVYALSNCILIRIALFNWNDVLILFPLILLQLEEMISGGEWKKYSVLLWLAMLCNFYTAYQLCIFLVMWFFLNIDKNMERKKEKLIRFVCSSLISAIAACIVILPSVICGHNRYSLLDGKAQEMKEIYIYNILVDFREFITKLFIFDNTADDLTFAPCMYISIGAVVIALTYIFVKSELKIKNCIILFFLLLGIFCGMINYIWHGFSIPHGIYHRFLFLFVFMIAFVILDLVTNLKTINLKKLLILMLMEIVVLVISFFYVKNLLDFYVYLTTFILFTLYQIILILYSRKSISYKQLIISISVFIIGELFTNAVYQLKEYNMYSVKELYKADSIDRLLEKTELGNGERLEIIREIYNDGLLLDIPVNNIFMSYCNGKNVRLHKGFGMPYTNDAAYCLNGSSPLIDLIFNVRYGIGTTNMQYGGMEEVISDGTLHLYKDNRIAGLGYMVDSKITEWKGSDNGPYESQNKFAKYGTGSGDLFKIVKIDVKLYSLTSFKENEEYSKAGYYYYEYISQSPKEQEYSVMEFNVPEDMDLYITADNGIPAYSIVFIDDVHVHTDSSKFKQQTFHIGKVKKNQNIKICTMHEVGIGEKIQIWYQFASFNEEAYQNVYEQLSKNIYDIDVFESNYVSGKIHADKDGVMMTSIQAMDGFTVLVDGNEVKYDTIGAFIGVPLSAGDHKVEFKYITPYFKEGAVISLLGVVIYIALCMLDGRKRLKIIQ